MSGNKRKTIVILAAVLFGLTGCSGLEPKENANSFPDIAQIVRPASSETASSSSLEPYTPKGDLSENEQSAASSEAVSKTSEVSETSEMSSVSVDERPAAAVKGEGIDDFSSKWAYNNISEKQRRVYEMLFECAKNGGVECDVDGLGLTKDDIYTSYWAFDYDNPQFLELGSGYTMSYSQSNGQDIMKSVKIKYGRTPSEVPQADFDETTRRILDEARNMPNDYEKLKFIHDRIIDITVYTNTDALYESEADGAVVYGKALCEGYSKAFMYFAQSMGFECVCAVGTANGEDHMWNLVKLKGNWYNVDVTWDDPLNRDGSPDIAHDNFLVSDAKLQETHTINTPFPLPSAPADYS